MIQMTQRMHNQNRGTVAVVLAVWLAVSGPAAAQPGSLGGVQASTVSGAYVQTVPADSAAARAGLRAGDLVLQINGTPVASVEDVQRLLQSTKPGQTIQLGVLRNGQPVNVSVLLQAAAMAAPSSAPAAKPAAAPALAAATPIASGLYLRTVYFSGSLSINTLYFAPGNRLVVDPPHGVDPLDFDAVSRELPDRVGTYAIQGDSIRITWANGKTSQLPVEFDGGTIAAYDGGLLVKAEAYPPNQRLSGTYAWGGSTTNASAARTLQLSADGTYTMTSLGGIRSVPGDTTSAQETETGTYTLGGNTLVLRPANGRSASHTVMPFNTAIDPAKAGLADQHLIFDGISLVRER
ncbi:MAG TPA: PDZ domain-containing protein [Opitutales bacterium]|nr:PDZ domain-containing protein [Opitutales bacterium]